MSSHPQHAERVGAEEEVVPGATPLESVGSRLRLRLETDVSACAAHRCRDDGEGQRRIRERQGEEVDRADRVR